MIDRFDNLKKLRILCHYTQIYQQTVQLYHLMHDIHYSANYQLK